MKKLNQQNGDKRIKSIAYVFVLLFVSTLLSIPAFATVFNVTNTADGHAVTQLRGAIEAADAAGGTHTINVAAGTYNLTLTPRQLILGTSLAQNVTIIGAGPASTIINMTNDANRDRILLINPIGTTNGVVVNIQGIKFTNGFLTSDTFGGAGVVAGGGAGDSLTLTSCAFENNTIPAGNGGGGAVGMLARGNLTIDSCTFTNNISNDADGGAVNFLILNLSGFSGSLNVTKSTFTSNSLTSSPGNANGGALAFSGQGGISPTFNVSITKNNFINNTADGLGGAISANNSPNLSPAQIHYNRFIGNTSAAGAASNGLHFVESSGSVNADSNWWGCNTGPAAAACDRAGGDVGGGGSLTTSPWLQLRNVAASSTIVTGQGTILTADILGLSTGGSTAPGNLTGLAAFPAISSTIFDNPVRGSLSATNGQFVNGVANLTPTFTATSVGAGSARATADGQTATAAITINQASTTASIGTDTPDPSNVGQNVTVTYSVAVSSPGGGTPTGNVVVSDGATICTATVAAGQCTGPMNTAGTRNITATYQGDTNYNASAASPSVSHVVGQVTWTGGTDTNFATNSNWNTGQAPGSGDTVTVPTGATNQPNILGGNVSVSALSVAAGRTLTVTSPRTLTVSGTLTNNGTINGTGAIINNFSNAGTLAPGLSPGILNIAGNFANPGILSMEIGGIGGAGVNPNGHDQLLVSGTATLGGTLNVALTNAFTPAAGNSFLILDAASSTGTFTTMNLPNILPNMWSTTYNNAAGTVTLTVVAPTAANVSLSGRVFDTNGRGLSGAHVTLTDSSGNIVYSFTNPFGYYRFAGVAAGQDYVIGVTSKQYQFTPRLISASEEVTDINFVPDP